MSYPGRPPVTIPGIPLPPGMIPPPPFGMPGLPGMMPVPPGLAMVPPPMMGPVTVVTSSNSMMLKRPPVSTTPVFIKKPPTSQPTTSATTTSTTDSRNMSRNFNKPRYQGPPITVFVGNISDRGSDILIRQMLQKCGNVNNWKRVQGASGKLQAFGFCEYSDPESALRAIRILHEWNLGEKKLVVKVDAKTNTMLDEYKTKLIAETSAEGVEGENRVGDDIAKNSIECLIKECFIDISKATEEESKPSPPVTRPSIDNLGQARHNNPNLDDIEVDDVKKDLIHREIGKFREFCQKDAETKDKQKEITRERKERDIERERRERDLSPRDVDRLRHDNYRRSRSISVDKERDRDMDRNRERDNYSYRDRDRDRVRDNERDRNRDVRERNDKEKDTDEENDEKDRRRIERKLRVKEASYQDRLKNWETRERKKTREYEKEKEREEDKRKEEAKEAKRLKEFLEDYDDERDDPKYYRGNALSRRLKERDREIESDIRDRQKEKDEIDELRRRLTDEGHPDPLAEVRRRQREEDDKIREKLKVEQIKEKPVPKPLKRKRPSPSPPPPTVVRDEISIPPSNLSKPVAIIPDYVPEEAINQNTNSLSEFSDIVTPPKEEVKSKPIGFSGLKLGSSPTQAVNNSDDNSRHPEKKRKMSLGDVFSSQDEDTDDNGSRKRKLVPLEYTEEEMKAVGQQSASPNTPSNNANAEEKRKNIKNLIEKIPTAKEELFDYNLDRSLIDNGLMEKRIKPWVNKKIIEYIGEEEPTLVEFICSKVMAGSSPKSILDDVSMVLDDEAEVFVVKMWRLLIYEIEAKKLGIGK